MSPGPGRIEREYTIDLPRPRDSAGAEFNGWRRALAAQLNSHPGRKADDRRAQGETTAFNEPSGAPATDQFATSRAQASDGKA
jgi:hypothetical protein